MAYTLPIAHFAGARFNSRAGPWSTCSFHFLSSLQPNSFSIMSHTPARIFALDPMTRGFGYVLFEEPFNLVSWGVARVKGDKHKGAIAQFEQLLTDFEPQVVVLEDAEASGSRRSPRVRELIGTLVTLTRERGIAVHIIARTVVVKCFSTPDKRATKHLIATLLARQFPELAPKLPLPRKPWESEKERMVIFDALALAVTYTMS